MFMPSDNAQIIGAKEGMSSFWCSGNIFPIQI